MKDIFSLSPFVDFDEKSQNLYRQSVELRAKARNLPSFLRFCDVAILLGYEPRTYFHFIWTEPLDFHPIIDQFGVPFTLEARLISNTIPFSLSDKYGIHKEQFRQYLSATKQWPINNCLLANWWTDEEKNQDSKSELTKSERASMLEILTPNAGPTIPSYLDPDHPMYSKELSIAIEVWLDVLSGNPDRPKRGTRKALIEERLKKNYHLDKSVIERIAVMLNPDKNGGAPKTE